LDLMTEQFFDKVRGALSCYTDASDGQLTDCRIILCRFGEDPQKAIDQFWKENTGNFAVIPLMAYGNPPRAQLCSQKSLLAALQTVTFDVGSATEMQWTAVCQVLHVAWPKRLAA
jgi:hypothetical protein